MCARLGHPLPILAALVLAVALPARPPAPAAAHARLTASDPVNGAALDEMPTGVTFTFTEPVVTGSACITVDTLNCAFAPPRLVDVGWRWPRVPPAVPVLLLTAAVLLGVGSRGIRGSSTVEPIPAVILLTAVLAIAAGFTVQTVQQVDPAPADDGATSPIGELDLLAAADDDATVRRPPLPRDPKPHEGLDDPRDRP